MSNSIKSVANRALFAAAYLNQLDAIAPCLVADGDRVYPSLTAFEKHIVGKTATGKAIFKMCEAYDTMQPVINAWLSTKEAKKILG